MHGVFVFSLQLKPRLSTTGIHTKLAKITFIVRIRQRYCIKVRTVGEICRLANQSLVYSCLSVDIDNISVHSLNTSLHYTKPLRI